MRAPRVLQHLSSRGHALPSRWLRVRDGSLGESFGAFLLSEKSTYLLLGKGEKRVLFLCGQEKNEKKPRTYRSIVCAAGSGSMAAMQDGVHVRSARVIRQSPPFSSISCRMALTRRAPCACGLSNTVASRTACSAVACIPFAVRKHVSGAVCICFPAEAWEFEAEASTTLFVVFSSVRKRHIISFDKGETCSFLSAKNRTKRNRKRSA